MFFNSNGSLKEVNEVSKMYDSLQLELRVSITGNAAHIFAWVCSWSLLTFLRPQKACRDVEESERRVETLLADVAALRKQVNEKRGHRMEKGMASSSCRNY